MKFKVKTNPNPNVEFLVDRFASLLKYIGIISFAITICYAIYLLFNNQKELASTLILYSSITLLATLTVYYLLIMLVNISLTFNRLYTKVDNFTLDRLISTIGKTTTERATSREKQSSTPIMAYDIVECAPKIEPKPERQESIDNYNSEIISLINKGHVHMARHILVTEQHMSLSSADSFIKSHSKEK